jgi:quercetin dioxygenase-like cupin family protein
MTVIPGDSLHFDTLPGRDSADPLAGVDAAGSARIVRLARTAGRTAHIHPHSEEVVYVRAGTGAVWIDGISTPVTEGDMVHIPRGLPHATVPDEGQDMELICFFPHPDLAANIESTDIAVS